MKINFPRNLPAATASPQPEVAGNRDFSVWVIDDAPSAACIERLGDGRRLASAMGRQVRVLLLGSGADRAQELIHHGADLVLHADQPSGNGTKARTTAAVLKSYRPRPWRCRRRNQR